MSYATFAEKLLIALYQETERTGDPYQRVGPLLAKYGIDYKPLWISQVADEWEHLYFSDVSRVLNGYEHWSFRISAQGVREIESKYGSKTGVGEILAPATVEAEAGPASVQADASETPRPGAVVKTIEETEIISNRLQQALGGLDNIGLSNTEHSQARAYLAAALSIADSPTPRWDIVKEILMVVSVIAGVGGMIAGILALL